MKIKKIFKLCMVLGIFISFGASTVSAAWSGWEQFRNVPAGGGASSRSTKYGTKGSTDDRGSTQGNNGQLLRPGLLMVNNKSESRSNYCTLNNGVSHCGMLSSAKKGYNYYAIVYSNGWEPNKNHVDARWNPN